VDNVLVARDMVLGSIFYGIETMVTEPTHANHSEQLMRSILRGLCVPDKVAEAIAYAPLESIKSIDGPIFSRLKQSPPKVLTEKPQKKTGPTRSVTPKTGSHKVA
jgi:hypothetical protein